MAKVMRREVMEDTGRSHLKDKVLDILTNLRLERDVLNDTTTGPTRFKTSTSTGQPTLNIKQDN